MKRNIYLGRDQNLVFIWNLNSIHLVHDSICVIFISCHVMFVYLHVIGNIDIVFQDYFSSFWVKYHRFEVTVKDRVF